jgi:hypothetical protein
MKLTAQFVKIAKLAGKDPAKLLEEYNKTARVRGESRKHYVPAKDNKVPAGYKGYLFIGEDGKIMTIPPEVKRADGKVCRFHTAYQAVKETEAPKQNKKS